MSEVYLWGIEYQVSTGFGPTEREIKVVTKTDTYADAEKVAIKAIEKTLEESRLSFVRLLNIKPSKIAFAEI